MIESAIKSSDLNVYSRFFPVSLLGLVLFFCGPAYSQETKESSQLIKRQKVVQLAYDWMLLESNKKAILKEHGSDFLQFFYEVKSSGRTPKMRDRAHKDGVDFANRYRRYLLAIGAMTEGYEVTDAIAYLALASEFGVTKDRAKLRGLVEMALGRIKFKEVFELKAGEACDDPDKICDSIIAFHFARRAGFPQGKGLKAALKRARDFPYDAHKNTNEDLLIGQDNLATHVIYIQSDYGRLSLDPKAFKVELAYFRRHFDRVLKEKDVEGVAEFMDASRILGVKDDDLMMKKGLSWLLKVQAKDGHFGEGDQYDVYHSTWTALNALRRFRFQGTGPKWKLKNAVK
jgi:hypothetical protein